MTRISFLSPAGGCTAEAVTDTLALAGVSVPPERARTWAPLELLLAFDWAMREHLHASDSSVRRRERPAFLAPLDRECLAGCVMASVTPARRP